MSWVSPCSNRSSAVLIVAKTARSSGSPPPLPTSSARWGQAPPVTWSREVISIRSEPLAPPGPGQVLVEVTAAAVNHSEALALTGGLYSQGLTFPVPLGYEGAGTVVAAGPDTSHPVGARVCWAPSPGSCADYTLVPDALVARVPDALPTADAACVPTAAIAAWLLAATLPTAGRTVLVLRR